MLTSREIRQQFLDFFAQKHGHTFVPSSPVVPHGDPTLLFTNAGMNQFKDVFLGTGNRPYTRAVNTQKCIRAGGKHNDLEDVGKDTYHHTFFEMLGNWSFGDYFKKEAIAWAWQLLTEVWGLDKTRLHATVFRGDLSEGLAADEEAAGLWASVTDIDPKHIHRGSKKDNFWEMGETGPCGPCTEIHIDLTPDKSGMNLVNAGDPRVMEIWNLVFIQFNRDASGKLTTLPAKHVDTGMGFERVTAVLQNKRSNYDTDIFTPIFAAIRDVTKAQPYAGELKNPQDIAYRVIADHIRTLTLALTDGAEVSNEGRGYVLRRILRRAVRHGRQTLGVHEPFFHRLVPAVVAQLGDAFPELTRQPEVVAGKIREEEEQFGRTLDRGIELFNQAAGSATAKTISGEDAFKLEATYGFPIDLTEVMAEERGLAVDKEGYQRARKEHQLISQGEAAQADPTELLVEVVQRENPPATVYRGYDATILDVTTSCRLYQRTPLRLEKVASAGHEHELVVVLGATPFYAEAGGQVGDTGVIRTKEGGLFRVHDTRKVGEVYFHLGKVEKGPIASGEKVQLHLEVDQPRRDRIMANHTITHVMNRALRVVLGEHIQQKGSLVDEQKTRFDFSHGAGLNDDEIQRVQEMVNGDIAANLPVVAQVAPQEEALKIHGLRAVFGEKYPPQVRVVAIGRSVSELLANPGNKQWYDYSVEFCGGTHLSATGKARKFVLASEEAVAKGIRRLVGLTGELAEQADALGRQLQQRVEALIKADPEQMAQALPELLAQVSSAALPAVERSRIRAGITELQRLVRVQQKQQTKAAASGALDAALSAAEKAQGNLVVLSVGEADANALRAAVDAIRKKKPDLALLLGGFSGGKVAFIAAVPPALIAKGLKAGDWVKEVAKIAGGGGGGRPELAQAGGTDPSKLDEALEQGRAFALTRI